jgi:hypothetical protein
VDRISSFMNVRTMQQTTTNTITSTNTNTQTHKNNNTRTQIQTHRHKHKRTNTNTQTQTQTHKHTNTQTQPLQLRLFLASFLPVAAALAIRDTGYFSILKRIHDVVTLRFANLIPWGRQRITSQTMFHLEPSSGLVQQNLVGG